jgi:hypothetical protein
MANPVYMTSRSRMIELGARACSMVLVMDAKSRKNMLIDSIMVNATSKKKKNGPGSRRRFAMTASKSPGQQPPDVQIRGMETYSTVWSLR